MEEDQLPALSVIICTLNRPELLRQAIAAVAAQTVDAVIETIVVFDRSDPDTTLEVTGGNRPVRVTVNAHTPGLPGGRNTGVDLARAPLVAFCDDDDVWLPEKVARQFAVLERDPAVDVVVTGVRVVMNDVEIDRTLDRAEITFHDLLEDRVMEAHPSTVMVRREAFVDRIGPADEEIPGGYAEDYEWLLRAARIHPVAVVREPLVKIIWQGQSYFIAKWQMIADALEYLLAAFPEFASVPSGEARIRGQRSFALAALGKRSDAWKEIRVTLGQNWREPRAYLAGLVSTKLVSPDRVVRELNRRGRGI